MKKTPELAKKSDCCGCEACVSICPTNSISMIRDSEGFYYPKVDNSKCVKCNKCSTVCPAIKPSKPFEYKSQCYSGYIDDSTDLLSCASGGIATALSRHIINNGGIVFGVKYSGDYHVVQYGMASNIEELESFKGSKYIQSHKDKVYRRVKTELKNGKKVLFIGLPCDVAGLHSFLGKRYDNLILVDLICHGATSEIVHDNFVRQLELKNNSLIVSFNLRTKIEGWTPPYLKATFQNGNIFSDVFYKTQYGIAFGELSRPSCYHCKFKKNYRFSDITLGDFWGLKQEDAGWNKNGVSTICVNSKVGEELVNAMRDINLQLQSYEKMIENNPCYLISRSHTGRRHHFIYLLKTKGLSYACEHRYTAFWRVKSCLSKIKHKVIKNWRKL